jgi:hypothetical protein
MTDDIDDFFQNSYLESGSSLESDMGKILSQNFDVHFQPVFHDLDEGKSREGDILAKEIFPNIADIKPNKPIIGQLIIPIECKNLPDHGWIFTESKITQNLWHFTLIRSRNNILENLLPRVPLSKLRGTSSFLERIMDTKPGGKIMTNRQTNNIHDSSLKVVKLTRHLINQDKANAMTLYKCYNNARQIIFLKIYQPLIILNGRLYIKSANEQGITPVKYLQFYREYNTAAYKEEVTIHIITRENIEEYLSMIRSYYTIGAQYIIDHQNEIREKVQEDLIHWSDFDPFKISI